LYDRLVALGLLLPHEERDASPVPGAYKVLRPRQLAFVSYPYEWCFSQLRDAALATLQIQDEALSHGMTLKDASAFNIQFVDGRPVLIDILSFEALTAQPWVAYAQFCRHFLAPLALMSARDGRLGQLLRVYLDGVPLDLASKLLPARTWLRPSLLLHLHAHAGSERWFRGSRREPGRERKHSRESLLGLVTTLRNAVGGLRHRSGPAVWSNYYSADTAAGYIEHKERLVRAWLEDLKPATLWDLGANDGRFSRLAAGLGIETISFDADADCVEANYQAARSGKHDHLQPLVLDLANPTPALGWENTERMSWLDRASPENVLALALIHHLAIGNNVPLARLASFFAGLGPLLIVEFVPKDDPNARRLLSVREDVFSEYTREAFEAEFSRWYRIERTVQLAESSRTLYLMRRAEEPKR